jgi:hypothetical protein
MNQFESVASLDNLFIGSCLHTAHRGRHDDPNALQPEHPGVLASDDGHEARECSSS